MRCLTNLFPASAPHRLLLGRLLPAGGEVRTLSANRPGPQIFSAASLTACLNHERLRRRHCHLHVTFFSQQSMSDASKNISSTD